MPASPQRLALTLALLSTSCLSPVAFAKAALLSTASTDSLTLNGNDTLTLTPSGSLTTTKVAVTLKDDTRGSGVVIDNAGSLISTGGRAIDTSGSTRGERNYSIINRSGATIQGSNDALRIDTNFTSGSVLIDNSGTVRSTGSGQAIDLDSLRSEGVQTTLINREGGLIRGEFSDGMKTGSNATILNYGEISSGDALTDDNKFDGIDIDSATGVTVTNHGTLSGGRHGMTTDLGATLVNYGEVTGRNGSGFGSDGNGTVINYGTITGAYSGLKPNGDGDGVDIDLIAHIENYGVIQGTGAGGVDKNGFANGSEGIALGGGYLYNAAGALISGANNAVLVDDGSDGPGVAATRLINNGTIKGLDGFAVRFVGEFDDVVSNKGLISGSNGLALDLGGGDDHLTLGSGATLAYGVNADGSSAPVQVGGTAHLNGATLAINAGSGTYPWLSQYRVLSAGTLDGTFGNVTSDYAFLTPTLNYTPTSVELTYARNDVAFADYASSTNGHSAAVGLSQLKAGNALYNALLNTSTQAAGAAIEQLAGSSNASLSSATLGATSQVGSSMLAAMQSVGAGAGLRVASAAQDTPALAATGLPPGVRNLHDPNAQGRLWLQGLGSYGRLDGTHGNSDLTQRTKGGVLGADWALTPDWRMGMLGGYSKTNVDSSAMEGTVNSWHAGVYGIRQSGALAVRLGAAYSGHNGNSKRSVAFNGFTDQPKGDYHASSQQAFAELGYALGSGRLSAEPFANLGYQRYQRDHYTEKGGAAALSVDKQTQDNFSSTLGVRLAHLSLLENGMSITPRLSAGWKHTYGDVSSSTNQRFVLGGSAFNVEGSALDRNSLVLEAGLDIGVSARQTLGVGYTGDMGSNSRTHGLIGQWQMSF